MQSWLKKHFDAEGITVDADTLHALIFRSGHSMSILSSEVKKLAAYAKTFVGYPYVYGGSSPSGFDCSGFTSYIYKQFGYSLNRTCSGQLDNGTPVAMSELQPGDLVFFQNTYKAGISHVGIYVGDGKFIHSPNSRSVVSYADLYSDYYTNHYYSARRICGN